MAEKKIIVLAVLAALIALFVVNTDSASGLAQNKCFPVWDEQEPITIDKEMKRLEFVQGDSFTIKGNYGSVYDCEYQFGWEVLINGVLTNAVIIKDTHAKITIATVGASAKSGDVVVIRGVFTHLNDPTGARSEKEVKIYIVDRPLPPEINLVYGEIKSFTYFSVDWSQSKAQGGPKNFVYSCSFVLKDEQKTVVDKKEGKAAYGLERPPVSLTTKGAGIYSLEATCADSHGSSSTITQNVFVDMSDSGRNKPAIVVNKTLICDSGKDCIIDFSKTNAFNKSIKGEYYDITKGDNKNVPAHPCGSEKCLLLNLTKPGVYKIKLKLWFSWYDGVANRFRYSEKSEAVVTVTMGQVYSQTVSPKPTIVQPQRQIVRSTPPPSAAYPAVTEELGEFRRKSSPGVGTMAFLAILAAVLLIKRKSKRSRLRRS